MPKKPVVVLEHELESELEYRIPVLVNLVRGPVWKTLRPNAVKGVLVEFRLALKIKKNYDYQGIDPKLAYKAVKKKIQSNKALFGKMNAGEEYGGLHRWDFATLQRLIVSYLPKMLAVYPPTSRQAKNKYLRFIFDRVCEIFQNEFPDSPTYDFDKGERFDDTKYFAYVITSLIVVLIGIHRYNQSKQGSKTLGDILEGYQETDNHALYGLVHRQLDRYQSTTVPDLEWVYKLIVSTTKLKQIPVK